MRRAILTLLALLVLPAAADAQRHRGCCSENRFTFSPYAGLFKDAYDAEADGSDLGWMIGFRAGYDLTDRVRLQANLGYAEANDIASEGIGRQIVDDEWVITTIGAEFALVPGSTSINLGGEAGIIWRRTPVQDADVAGDDGWATYEVIAPSLTLRHDFSRRAGLFLSLHDYISDVLENSADHSPALTVGLSFR